jgi:hypothetical protein
VWGLDGAELNVLNIIKREITRPRHPRARRNPTFYPSSASAVTPEGHVLGGCWRSDWYRIHNVVPTNESELYMHMIWHLGRAIESKLIDAMKCAGIYENDGVKFYDPKHNVSGELDIVGRYRRKDQSIGYYGIEVKSVYGIGVSKTIMGRSRAWRGQKAFDPFPKESNIMQTMVYLDQFSKEHGDGYHLEFFKLVYMPRDKPNDGREYTVRLVTKADLDSVLLAKYGPKMKDGERYAQVETDGFSTKIEVRFSLEDMYSRWLEEKEMFKQNVIPVRPYKKFYSPEEIDSYKAAGMVSKTMFEAWEKAGKPKSSLDKTPGHFLCKSYCDYRDFCYDRLGQPRKEADMVGLVQIADPKEEVENA